MALIIDLPLTDRFSSLVKGLLTYVVHAVPTGWVEQPLLMLMWRQMRRMTYRFAAIMAQLEAGTLPEPGSAPARPAPARPADAPPPPDKPRSLVLPRHVGWFIQIIAETSFWNDELKATLADPRMAEAVARAPHLGRTLRPLCRMLGVRVPAWLRLPRRPRPPRPSRAVQHPPAPEWLKNEPGAICKPDGTIWMRFGASTKWRPGYGIGDTLEEAQKFDPPVRVWPRSE